MGNTSDIGVAFNKDKPTEPAVSAAHAYVPDDDDDSDDWQRALSIIATIAAFVAGMWGIGEFVAWVPDKAKK